MDVREKLVELIEQSGACFECFPVGDYEQKQIEKIANHLIAHGVTVQEWISVNDRLPEKEGEYITYTDKGEIHFDCFCIYPNHGTKFWVGGNGKVTHWMPLPEPPKGE